MSKQERVFKNLLKVTRQLVEGKGYKRMAENELMQKLALPEQHQEVFHQVIETLINDGAIENVKGKLQVRKVKDKNTITGILHAHPKGFGFVTPEDENNFSVDVFIPKNFMQNAIDGDLVEVEIKEGPVSEKGPEGKVISILSRAHTHLAGIVREIDAGGTVLAYVALLGPDRRVVVRPSSFHLRVGDRIVMKVLEWGDSDEDTHCIVLEYIGHISDPSVDIKATICEYELRAKFPSQVIEEAHSFGKRVLKKDLEGREDLTALECFTIDPDTAKDFDDAVSLSKDKEGYHLGVHIADVSYYVSPGTALDEEARLRCNSTYFPSFCLPMLPSELSDNLCSLKSDVNRLTVSVFIDFDHQGNTLGYRISRSFIKSRKRFTYREAMAVIDGKKQSPHAQTLLLMVELCHLLKQQRYQRGSIEFALPELMILVDEKGVPHGTDYVAYDISHKLVEEFMLKANEIVATHVTKQGKSLTFRVHEEPSEENLRDFSILAQAFGFELSKKPKPFEIQKLFDEALDTPYGPYLATSYIRRMRLAIYSPDNIGHYGLNLTHYCHFTSPIRRYVDLVAHRILFDEIVDQRELEHISAYASERERISAKAENAIVLLKKLRYLEILLNKDPYKQFEAIITRVKPYGIYFEIAELMLEGFLHVSELGNDYFIYEENKMRFRGRSFGAVFAAGERILVLNKSIDLILLETGWNFVDVLEMPKEKPGKRKKALPKVMPRKPLPPARSLKTKRKKMGAVTKKTGKRSKKKK